MKKTFAVLVVLLVALMAVSAAAKGDIVVGANIAYDINNYHQKDMADDKVSMRNIPLTVSGQYYITDEISAYAEVGAAFGSKVYYNGEDYMDSGEKSAAALVVAAGASYTYEIQKGINAIGSVGIGNANAAWTMAVPGHKTRINFTYWTIDLTAAGTYQLDKKNGIDLTAGVRCGIPVTKFNMKVVVDGETAPYEKPSIAGFSVTPFFGATMAF